MSHIKAFNSRFISVAVSTIITGISIPALAQDRDVASGANRTTIEEVVVTARRREESIQNVPVAVTALTGEQLESASIQTLEELRFIAPALLVSPTNFGSSVPGYTIRGQRQQTPITPQDNSVMVYFADFALAKSHGTNDVMYDLESVQVLKGPQGTLFGRNTTGGAVLINPKKPDLEAGFSGDLTLEAGNYDLWGGTAAVNGVLSDTVAVRAAGKIIRRDGYVDSLYTDEEFDDNSSESWRLGLLWTPNDRVESYTVYQHYKQDNAAQAWKLTEIDPNNGVLAAVQPDGLGRFQEIQADLQQADFYTAANGPFDGYEQVDAYFVTNTTSWQTDAITLKNIVGYRDVRVDITPNYSGTDFQITGFQVAPGVVFPTADTFAYYAIPNHTVDGDQFSNEFQVLGTALDDRLNWIAGLYYFTEEAEDFQTSELIGRRTNHGTADNESYSVFAQITHDLAAVEGLSFTVGARYTWEDRELEKFNMIQGLFDPQLRCRLTKTGPDGSQVPLDPCVRTVSFEDDAPTWTLGLEYDFSDAVMAYISTRRGYRSGGLQLFTQRDDEPQTFESETVDDYELGIKSTWDFDTVAIRVNAAIYRQDYQDIQRILSFVDPSIGALSTRIVNAAEATIDGGELEFTILPSDDLEISGFIGYVDAQYDEFINNFVNPPVDLTENDFAFVPETTMGVQARVRLPIAPEMGEIWLRGSWYRQDEFQLTDGNVRTHPTAGINPDYDVFDLAGHWTNIVGSNFDARLTVKNVTAEKYYTHGLSAYDALGFTTRLLAPPRTVVGQITYHFGH